ncbi:hypothetical protein EJ02DRAFT_456025 [Clathrospora elynae]|uniref:Secreted protein n=1 Tax=Clathrospora elynae TaxID=706981 RepID=A0A6A5SL11_9PLEO|nr:hypothetical protein EJ02DRAFT_456025 [Clathrospora elynae]
MPARLVVTSALRVALGAAAARIFTAPSIMVGWKQAQPHNTLINMRMKYDALGSRKPRLAQAGLHEETTHCESK